MEPVSRHLRRRRWPAQPICWLAGKHFGFWEGVTNESFDRVRHAAKLACPLLVMHGTDDDLCPLDSGRTIAEAASDGAFVTFDGATHENLARYDPKKYEATLQEFFTKLHQPWIETIEH